MTWPVNDIPISSLFKNPKFEITLDEAKSLLKLLQHEFISREPHEDYERIMRVLNGLTNFVDNEK